MTVKKQILIILFFIGITFVYSCKKNTEHDIIGTWERVIVENSNADYTEDWIIDSDHIYIVKTKNGISDTTDQGTYVVKAGLTKKIIRTNGFSFAWFNNLDWKIEKLKGGQLVMFSDRDNYFLYYEFVKK